MTALNENAQKWVDALRSGKYAQTKGHLHDSVGYCCLGVACELAIEDGVDISVAVDDHDGDPAMTIYDECWELPPEKVQRWLGLKTEEGKFGHGSGETLADRNDAGATFAQIAKLIERHADELGVKS